MISLGIDFGTSTTVMAGCGARLELLKDDTGQDVVPSVVALTPQGTTEIGSEARHRLLIDPTNTLYSTKRVLGKLWGSPEANDFRKNYPFELKRAADGTVAFETRAGELTTTEVVERFIACMRKYQSVVPLRITNVVATVPERADQRQKLATSHAIQLAGFPQPDLISEPAAAVLSYTYEESGSYNFLVYDLGGGTFDAALVRWDGKRPSVLEAVGDSQLGGDDIDIACANWVAEELLREHRWDVRSSKQSYQSLMFLCEQAKIRLSVSDSAEMNLWPIDEALRGKKFTLSRSDLERLTRDLIDKTTRMCTSLVELVPKLDGVLMIGGSTYMPLIRRGVERALRLPVITRLPADRVVAMGAALLAKKRLNT